MAYKKPVTILVSLIVILSGIAATSGIFSDQGPGSYDYETIRGKTVEIYGKGIYKHMSADVAIQGIAQDYVTLFIGVPLLILLLPGYRKGSLRHHFLLAGTMGYFLVTYLFYMTMGMYNIMFLGYVTLLGLTFFGLFLLIRFLDSEKIAILFSEKTPHKFVGGFLIFNAIAIAFLWLGVVIPPLLEGTVYPDEVQHYTTLIVQGFDLGLLLPVSLVVGLLLYKKRPAGLLFGTVYIVFLAILMTALTAKIIAMSLNDVNVIPVIFIIPTINVVTILCVIFMIRNISKKKSGKPKFPA